MLRRGLFTVVALVLMCVPGESYAGGGYRWEIEQAAGSAVRAGYVFVSHHSVYGTVETLRPLPGTKWRCTLESMRKVEVLPGVLGYSRTLFCDNPPARVYQSADLVFVPRPPDGGAPIGKGITMEALAPGDNLVIRTHMVWPG